jgi:hypothetical protein
VQQALAQLDWIRLVPRHFLHVWLAGIPVAALRDGLPFELEYARVNCFHAAVVVEVRAPELSALHPEPTFLPHLTIGVTTRRHSPDELRRALVPLRERRFGRQRATVAKRISFPAGRTTVLEPWTVVEVVSR